MIHGRPQVVRAGLHGLDDGLSDAALVQPDVVRSEEDLWGREPFHRQGQGLTTFLFQLSTAPLLLFHPLDAAEALLVGFLVRINLGVVVIVLVTVLLLTEELAEAAEAAVEATVEAAILGRPEAARE